ncbi:hypothetical protein P3X46_019649 [Hevea brasiliensis]|uniref:Pectinesterase inhibitor domain-containing protein n=1 Tax=Hevea brasiliensis TaxID=3981 RepID=A0ABQ9LJD0_HEVBR|nr:hypothetical protein P3X46_019649 [Hevea brasiliensis]
MPPFFSLLLFLCLSFTPNSAAPNFCQNAQQDLVRSSCLHATNTPRDLAQATVRVGLVRARKVSKYLSTLSRLKTKRERVALSDCLRPISDSLKHLRVETFQWQMNNADTRVSAALTNEDTCLDGFEGVESKVKSGVKRKITNMAKVTSNALYVINRLDESSRTRPR